jgi:hypothetical protein
MKKIYVSLLLAGATFAATAQQAFVPAQNVTLNDVELSSAAIAAGEDTLGLEDFSTSLQFITEASGAGYIFGTFYQDTSISQGGQTIPLTLITSGLGRGFIANDPYNVTGAMIWFHKKHGVNASPADLNVSLHAIAEDVAITSASSQSGDGPGPGAELATVSLPFDDIDTSSTVLPRTIVSFDSPVWVNGDMAIVVDIEPLYGASVDTVVVLNEASGTSLGDGTYTYIRQAALNLPVAPLWIAASANGLEVDMAIFAIVEESGVGIEEQGFVSGVKMTTYPNPALSGDVVRVQYGLESAAERVEINIVDMNGKLVHTIAEGDRAAGIHTVEIPAGTLTAGSYIYSLQANGGRIAKRLEILK